MRELFNKRIMRESLLISDDKSLDPATGAMLHFVMIQSDGA